jgi:hypothetical protein
VASNLKVNVTGGLGNQLFKVMAGYQFSQRLGNSLVIDTSWYEKNASFGGPVSHRKYELDFFPYLRQNLVLQSNSKSYRWDRKRAQIARRINGKIALRAGFITDVNYQELKISKRNYVMDGNFENWLLLPADEELTKLLELPRDYSAWFEENQKKLDSSDYITLHIRMGDYLNLPHIYDVLTPRYYVDAVAQVREVIGALPIVLFSDNTKDAINWLSNAIKIDQVIENDDFASAGEVLVLQSMGRVVAAHSTFSWWSAKLGTLFGTTKCVAVPSRYFRDPLKHSSELHVQGWLKVNV